MKRTGYIFFRSSHCDKVMLTLKSCYSINLCGINSIHTVHQGFYFSADVTVWFHLIHCYHGCTMQCCVMQILYMVEYLVFSMSTAMIAHTKEQHSTPTYFPYFLTSLLYMDKQEVQNFQPTLRPSLFHLYTLCFNQMLAPPSALN